MDATPEVRSGKREQRECYVGSPGFFLLDQASLAVGLAFNSTPYLVGSSVERQDWRDVDVRVMLDDDEWERLFPGLAGNPRTNALWSLMCSAMSLILAQATGLPVDFQIQCQSVANELYPGASKRVPLGIFPTT
jgi:hypothetical protein